MKNDNSKNIIIALLVVIIIILGTLVVLFATDIISLNINNSSDDNNEISNNVPSTNDDNNMNEQIISRNDIIDELQAALTNEEWIKEHLYSKENCFGQKVEVETQKLTFVMLSDEKNNPIVIVLNDSFEDFIKVIYKVYYEDGNILVQNITDSIAHPSHVFFSVDKNQGLVIETYAHMGYYTFKAYDVKNEKIKIYDEYKCTTGNCDYEYKGEKKYNISDVSVELNSENINNYIK